MELRLVEPSVRRADIAAGVVVPLGDDDRGGLEDLSIHGHAIAWEAKAEQLSERLQDIGSLADAALELEVDISDDMGVETDAGHGREAAAVGQSDIGTLRRALRDRAGDDGR